MRINRENTIALVIDFQDKRIYINVEYLGSQRQSDADRDECEEDREQLDAFAQRWGYESIETEWRQVIERDDIDLIDVCAPNFLHHDMVIAAAEAGKHVFSEKPVAVDAPGVRSVLETTELAHKKNVCVVSGLNSRYSHRMQELMVVLQREESDPNAQADAGVLRAASQYVQEEKLHARMDRCL